MTDLKTWSDRAIRRPLIAAVAAVACLQLAYLGFLARAEFLAQRRRVDRLVEAASLGIQQDNRPLIETALLAGLNDSDVRQAALCHDGSPVVSYPPGANPCRGQARALLRRTLARPAIGVAGQTFVFVLDYGRTFHTVVLLLAITGMLGIAVALILLAARRRFADEIMQPLRRGLGRGERLDIKELEDLRQRVEEVGALRRKEAVSEALLAVSIQVAHDIRSPLAVLESACASEKAPEIKDRAVLRAAVARVHDIAESLLARYAACRLSSPANRAMAAPSGHDNTVVAILHPMVEQIVAEKRVEYRRLVGLTLEVRFAEAASDLRALLTPVEFKRLLSNLLNNAVEALSDGQGRVEVRLDARDGHILLSVADNGCGIDAKTLLRLGETGATSGKAAGSGLGLAHARACAIAWGGSLSLESEPGRGTTTTLTLPAVALDAKAELFDAVLIDDDELVRRLWLGSASDNGKKLRVFPRADALLAVASSIDRRSPIYVDHELADGERGEVVARQLRAMGFTTLYLATGQSPAFFKQLPWLTEVVGKTAPWSRRPTESRSASPKRIH